eukprot:1902813-Rhodomonas_salina.1
MTLLMQAASYGHVGVVRKLVAAGADRSAQQMDGWTALHFAQMDVQDEARLGELVPLLADTSTLHGALRARDVDAVGRLIEAKCDVNEVDKDGRTPVYYAAEKGQTEAVRRLLAAGCEVEKEDKSGSTPLFAAAFHGHTAAVSLLIEAKCEVDKQLESTAMTPLALAAGQGHVEVVQQLLAGGADKTLPAGGASAWETAQANVKDSAKLTALMSLLDFGPAAATNERETL